MVRKLDAPHQAVMGIPGMDIEQAELVATKALERTKDYLPRATGGSSATLATIFGHEWFGLEWDADAIWYQEEGIKPFTMRSLAGKTIPMWVKDRDGSMRTKNPKIKQRTRADTGEIEVLIFRKAAQLGARKESCKVIKGKLVQQNVPASYPGAPGRIAVNRSQGVIRQGDVDPNASNPGQIAKKNVGVRWRHPGLDAGRYMVRGMTDAAEYFGYPVQQVDYLPVNTLFTGDAFSIIMTRK